MKLPLHYVSIALLATTFTLSRPRLHAQEYVIHEVMSGLVTPRGLSFGPDGGLYVAEAGRGGNGPSVILGNGATAFLGTTSGLSRLLNGVQERVLDNLPSIATSAGLDASGLQDVAFDSSGQAYGLFAFGSEAAQRTANLGTSGAHLGTIARLSLDGSQPHQLVADLAAHEFTNNPAGGNRDSNPFGMTIAPNGDFLVADAGGNDILRATVNGNVSTLAVLPARANPLSFGPPVIQPVPTSIAIGPDSDYYVGQLTGFPFPVSHANVYRYQTATEALTVAYPSFTNIIDVTFDAHGDLYVLQLTNEGLAAAMPGTGVLVKIDTSTGARRLIASDGLVFPGSVVAGRDGTVYVTNHTNVPSGGQVLRITPVPEPAFAICGIAGLVLSFVALRQRVSL